MNAFYTSKLATAGVTVLTVSVFSGGLAPAAAPGANQQAPTSPVIRVSSQRRPVPASLKTAESAAEDVVGLGEHGKRSGVVRKARELKRNADGAATRALRSAGVSPQELAVFRARASRVAELAPNAPFVDVSLAANHVSQLMPGFYARFSDPVPPSVLRLDYLDREAQLRSVAGQPLPVKAAVKDLDSTWTRLRPKVVESGGGKVARQYDRHVGAMKRLAVSTDDKELQQEAVHGLDLVDLLEGIFLKK